MTKTILVVDDDLKLRDMLRTYLVQEGYRVVGAANGREALFRAREEPPLLIILDVMMPEMDGYEFMRIYGKEATTPIIMLTAKMEAAEKVYGLELGADDYLTKPFSVIELLARIRAVLRRGQKQNETVDVSQLGEIELNRTARTVKVRGQTIYLTPSEFEILDILMSHPGRAFSRLDLLERVAIEGYERTVDVHVRNLRLKIEVDAKMPRYIQTIYGMGYRFEADS